jgi:hypothetical protein
MNTKFAATALILATSLMASSSFADVTRAQVKAELAEAVRTGNILASDDSGRMLNEVRPDLYPAQTANSTLTRAQVKAELATAIRTGNMPANDDSGLNLNQVHPHFYPAL